MIIDPKSEEGSVRVTDDAEGTESSGLRIPGFSYFFPIHFPVRSGDHFKVFFQGFHSHRFSPFVDLLRIFKFFRIRDSFVQIVLHLRPIPLVVAVVYPHAVKRSVIFSAVVKSLGSHQVGQPRDLLY